MSIQDLVQHNDGAKINNSIDKSLNFPLGSKYIYEALNRFSFDYMFLIWLGYLRDFLPVSGCLILIGHILEI